MTNPLWTDERIVVCADIHSEGHYATDNKAALEFRISCALKEMRNEYEAEVQALRRKVNHETNHMQMLSMQEQ